MRSKCSATTSDSRWRNSREAGGRILYPDLAKQVNGGAVQAVRQFLDFIQFRHLLSLANYLIDTCLFQQFN